ncbi:glycoside hydrolase family 3 N-terminal domain-containing protein [Herbiconiux liangxiaofengii]|uniref:glycoside hydrolase family 3 N-terminal domain-containing protein n=1 Tax=Herbiconiux liangxiaofengii TaxID=3342795 RepID=UPI0035B8CEC3
MSGGVRGRAWALAAMFVAVAITAAGCTGLVLFGSSASPGPAGSPGSVAGHSASSGVEAAGAGRVRAAFPVMAPRERIRLYAEMRLSTMTLEQKLASLFMVHVGGTDPVTLNAYLAAEQPGGLLLLGDNVRGSSADAAALTASLTGSQGLGTLVAIDEEGGIVARLGDDVFPSAVTLKNEPADSTGAAFASRADLLQATGMTVNFGVVADVTADPASFIFERALGTDAASAAPRVAAAVSAERGHVFSTLKHFPGHGAAAGDSHTSVPSTSMGLEQWRTDVAPPFEAGIDAGAELVMFGHLAYTAVDPAPASLSAEWHRILRDDLGFDGVAVTDDLLMLESSGVPAYADRSANAAAALRAGNDLLLYDTTLDLPPLVASLAAGVRAGTIPAERVDEAALRVLTLRRILWVQQHPTP